VQTPTDQPGRRDQIDLPAGRAEITVNGVKPLAIDGRTLAAVFGGDAELAERLLFVSKHDPSSIWLVLVQTGSPGVEFLIDSSSVERAYERIKKGELPPLLPQRNKAKSSKQTPESQNGRALPNPQSSAPHCKRRLFKRSGEGWILAWDCKPVFLLPRKGFEHMHLLLSRPLQWIEVSELATGVIIERSLPDDNAIANGRKQHPNASINVFAMASPEAISSVKRSKQDLTDEIEHLKSLTELDQFDISRQDPEAELKLAQDKLGQLDRWLKETTYKGCARMTPVKAKTSYTSVRNALDRARAIIKKQPELLGMFEHLHTRIIYETYTYCYLQDSSVSWDL
jgi:hypothetical protein